MRQTKCQRGRRRAFSIPELLVGLTITATLMTATLSALSASFESYKQTSESASTHVVARIVMQRLTTMIRMGEEFGPYPVNPILTPEITSDWMEFVSSREPSGKYFVTTLRRVASGTPGRFNLQHTVTTFVGGVATGTTAPVVLLEDLTKMNFELHYDVGPRLKRVTIDMVIQPDDLQDAAIAADLESPHIRLVASAAPRRYDD